MRKKLLYLAQLKDSSGYSVAARGYFRVLTSMEEHFDVKCVNISFEEKVDKYSWIDEFEIDRKEYLEWSKGGFTLIWHMPAPTVGLIGDLDHTPNIQDFVRSIFADSRKNIQVAAWETDRLPTEWLKVYEDLKPSNVIVPSIWNKTTFSKHVDTILIPHVVDEVSGTKEKNKTLDDSFVFLSVSQWSYRKGFDALVKSYLTEFINHEDTILVLKTYLTNLKGSNSMKDQLESLKVELNKIKRSVFLYDGEKLPKIMLIPSMLTKEKLDILYNSSDVYVSTTRGEGFGLTLAEASLRGLPVIATDKGGHIDFLEDFYEIKSAESPCFNMPFYSSLGNLFEPSVSSCKEMMRYVYENKDSLKTSRDFTREYLSARRIKELFLKNIEIF